MSVATDRVVRVGIAGLGRSGWSIHVTTLEPMPDRSTHAEVSGPERVVGSMAGRAFEIGRASCRERV